MSLVCTTPFTRHTANSADAMIMMHINLSRAFVSQRRRSLLRDSRACALLRAGRGPRRAGGTSSTPHFTLASHLHTHTHISETDQDDAYGEQASNPVALVV